ncbi:hypothetical protein ACJX0J_025236, partial [Zea mays]
SQDLCVLLHEDYSKFGILVVLVNGQYVKLWSAAENSIFGKAGQKKAEPIINGHETNF